MKVDWASRIRTSANNSDLSALISDARAARDPLGVLGELGRHRDPIVRAWAADHAFEVAGAEAIPLVWTLTEDPDPDVRDEALANLLATDASARERIAARLRKQATTRDPRDFHGPQTAIWRLVDLGESDIGAILDRVEQDPVWPWHRAVAIAARLVLTRDDQKLAALIGDSATHQHELNPSLMVAARRLPTPMVLEALRACERDDPESDCRSECGRTLTSIEDGEPEGFS